MPLRVQRNDRAYAIEGGETAMGLDLQREGAAFLESFDFATVRLSVSLLGTGRQGGVELLS